MKKKYRLTLSRNILILLFIFFVFTTTGFGENLNQRHLFFCLDSVPYSVFMKAKNKGLFNNFENPSRMISTFPALTNYAWSVILNAGEVEGYQTRYYDPVMNRLEGGFKDLFKSKGFPNKFDYIQENLITQLQAYIFGWSAIDKKMNNLGEKVLSSNMPRLFFAFIGISDNIAHMKGEKGLDEILLAVDAHLKQIQEEHLKKFNEPLEVTMLSDHASTLQKGQVINIYKTLKEGNFNPVKNLNNPDDVIYHTSGILSVAPFFIQEPRREELAHMLAEQPWAELTATYNKRTGHFLILSQTGSIEFEYSKKNNAFRMKNLKGEDPSGLTEEGLALEEWIPQSDVFQASFKTNFPDGLKRIQMSLNGNIVKYPASVLVSIKYGYESSSSRFLNWFSGIKKSRHGTHGGLAALDSIGFISSTRQVFPEWMSAYEIQDQIKDLNFALRYEDMTFLWNDDGTCRMRLGQELLDLAGAESIQFYIKTLANEKYTLSNTRDIFAVNLSSQNKGNGQAESEGIFDVPLPSSINSGYIYRIEAHVLNFEKNIIAQTKTKPFRIKHVRGYLRIPLQNYFSQPKKNSKRQWAHAKQIVSH
ncbi:hypothetical protein ACFLRW_01125 [Acidobacteriota bacterium]